MGPTQNLESTAGLRKAAKSCFLQTCCLLFYGEVRTSKHVVVFYPLAQTDKRKGYRTRFLPFEIKFNLKILIKKNLISRNIIKIKKNLSSLFFLVPLKK